jgi:hypothetical protein
MIYSQNEIKVASSNTGFTQWLSIKSHLSASKIRIDVCKRDHEDIESLFTAHLKIIFHARSAIYRVLQ